jgi:tetratricopeptide (TPR) repeat protein
MKRTEKKNIIFFLALGLLALILRLWNVISIGDDLYANFLSDASTFKLWASQIVTGIPRTGPVFPMGPLYPYFLAFALKLGFSFYSVLSLQAILGSVVAVMLGILAGRIFGRTAGYISGIMTACYAPFIFYDGLLLSESVQVFLLTLAVLFLVPVKKGSFLKRNIFLSGFFIGLTALGRGTIVIFPLLVSLWWLGNYLFRRDAKARRYPLYIVLLLGGVVIGIIPATMHNLSHGDFVPLSSNFGINFYIGNNVSSGGTYEEPAGINLSTDFSGRGIAEKESGRLLKSSEVSAFWSARTWDYIKNDPGSFVAGSLRKAYLYLWWFDIPQAESIQIQREFSGLFKLPLVGFGLVLLFGIPGIVFCGRDDRIWIVILLLFANLLGVMAFFVIGRFKLIGSLALLITSGVGVEIFFRSLKNHNWKKVIRLSSLAVIVGVVIFLPRPVDIQAKLASAYDNVGIYNYYKNRPGEAIRWYRRALSEMPDHSGALNNAGAYFYAEGDIDSARSYFHRSLKSDPGADKTLLNLGRIARDMGMIDSAYYYYERAKEAAPFGFDADLAIRELDMLGSDTTSVEGAACGLSFDALLRLAEQASVNGQYEKAEKLYSEALEIRPDDIRALNNLGFAYQAQSKFELASDVFLRVLELSEGNAVAFNNLASVVYRMGLVDSAIYLWQEALRHDPDNLQIKKNLDYAGKSKNL